jgi:hypothetical protein
MRDVRYFHKFGTGCSAAAPPPREASVPLCAHAKRSASAAACGPPFKNPQRRYLGGGGRNVLRDHEVREASVRELEDAVARLRPVTASMDDKARHDARYFANPEQVYAYRSTATTRCSKRCRWISQSCHECRYGKRCSPTGP